MQRTLQPELLDSLPADHPDALHNRRDLRRINQIVGSHRWLTRNLPPRLRAGERALEIGAGTGELGRRFAARGIPIAGLDLWPRPADWPKEQPWHQDDLREFDGYENYAAVIGNLIFHQFSDIELGRLGAKLQQRARVILACEPYRRRASQLLYRVAGPLFGANHVSLHDAHVSVAAGFRDDELPRLLELDPRAWEIHCTTTVLGMYRMVAVRRS
jgi:hypothetical protein